MRYFFRAAGRTFHVGSSKLTLKLFKLSELSCFVGFGAIGAASVVVCGRRDLSEGACEVEGKEDGPGFRL